MLRVLAPKSLAIAGACLLFSACDDDDASARADTGVEVGVDAGNTDAIDSDTSVGEVDPCLAGPRCDALATVELPRLSEHAAVVDDMSGHMIVFGGTTGIPENCSPSVASHYVGTTWRYDDGCAAWEEVTASGPTARGRHAMAGGDGHAYMYGGRWRADGASSGDYDVLGDLWALDLETSQWTELSPVGGGPSARVNHSMAWDSTRNRVLLFGGSEVTGLNIAPLNDVWAYDPATNAWEELVDNAGPDPRLSAAVTYDASRDWLIVFGGFDDFGFTGVIEYFSDVWAFDLPSGEWVQLQNDVGGPDGRFGASLVHDTVADRYVIFAGHDDQQLGNRNDNWNFDPEARTWEELSLGDTFANEQTGICEFPPDFTTIVPALPERRAYGSFVWSDTCDHGLLFGGKTDCGAANDVWTYVDGVWTERVEATAGEVCVRYRNNPDNCANLCF